MRGRQRKEETRNKVRLAFLPSKVGLLVGLPPCECALAVGKKKRKQVVHTQEEQRELMTN